MHVQTVFITYANLSIFYSRLHHHGYIFFSLADLVFLFLIIIKDLGSHFFGKSVSVSLQFLKRNDLP